MVMLYGEDLGGVAKTIRLEPDDSWETLPYGPQCPLSPPIPHQLTYCRRVMQRVLRSPAGFTALTVPSVWASALDPIRRTKPRQVILDVAGVTYCDGAGLAFFAQIRRTAATLGANVAIEGLAPELCDLVQLAALPDPLAPQLRRVKAINPVSQIGKAVIKVVDDVRAMMACLGQLFAAITWALLHPRRLRWWDLLGVAEKAGANAIAVVFLLGFLIGLILAFQSAIPMRRYGATEVIPIIVSIAVVRELGPLIACILLAGRSGSAFAAEIGTMKVTEEISALQTLSLDPVRFLVVPRVLAVMMVTPLLSVFCSLMGVVGAGRLVQPDHVLQQSALSGPGPAGNYKHFAPPNVKRDVFEDHLAVIAGLKALNLNHDLAFQEITTGAAVAAGPSVTD